MWESKLFHFTLKLRYNARAYIIMRASYDRIDNKQNMFGKVNLVFLTSLHSTELFKIFFSPLTLQLLFCKKLVSREKMCGKVNKDVTGKNGMKLYSCRPNSIIVTQKSNLLTRTQKSTRELSLVSLF